MPPDFWTYAFLCVSAFLAGVMNSVAGGGTLLTFPALTSVISAAMANGSGFTGYAGWRKAVQRTLDWVDID